MSDPERTDLISAVTALARRYPHWRFGQLVANIAGWADADVWDIEDDQFLAAASAHLDAVKDRSARPHELLDDVGVK